MGRNEGVLPDRAINELFEARQIIAGYSAGDRAIQPASLDLRLGDIAYRVRASFLPGKERSVEDVLSQPGLQMHEVNLSSGAVLETGCVYIVPLQESLELPPDISGRANPKSSTGRIDVFTRVVTNRGEAFDDVPIGYEGSLYLEISPRTFSMLARTGDTLAQLRLRRGVSPETHEKTVSIDLKSEEGGPVGWRAKRHAGVVDLRGIGAHDPEDYWEPIRPTRGRIVLNPEEFYILASRETVEVPVSEAAENGPHRARTR